jgi:hypothetical protein
MFNYHVITYLFDRIGHHLWTYKSSAYIYHHSCSSTQDHLIKTMHVTKKFYKTVIIVSSLRPISAQLFQCAHSVCQYHVTLYYQTVSIISSPTEKFQSTDSTRQPVTWPCTTRLPTSWGPAPPDCQHHVAQYYQTCTCTMWSCATSLPTVTVYYTRLWKQIVVLLVPGFQKARDIKAS